MEPISKHRQNDRNYKFIALMNAWFGMENWYFYLVAPVQSTKPDFKMEFAVISITYTIAVKYADTVSTTLCYCFGVAKCVRMCFSFQKFSFALATSLVGSKWQKHFIFSYSNLFVYSNFSKIYVHTIIWPTNRHREYTTLFVFFQNSDFFLQFLIGSFKLMNYLII